MNPRVWIAAALTLSATGCGPKDKAVRIALAVPLTGDTGTEGQGIRRAVELAVEEANASGGLPFKVEVRSFDDRADPKEAVNVANLIVADPRTEVVIGHYNSGCAIPAARIYAKAGLPMIVPAATNPKVTSQQLEPGWSGPRNVFRVVPTDDVEGAASGEFLRRALKARRLAIVHDKTPYGQGLAEEVRRRFLELGGESASFDGISVGDKDFKALLTRLREARPPVEALYFGGLYTEAGLLLKQMRELGFSVPFLSGDASKTSGLFDVAGAAADGAYLAMVGAPAAALPGARRFLESYRARYPSAGEEMKPFDHFAYEAAQVALDALRRAGPDRAAILAAVRAMDRDGILGRVRFDEKGDTLNRTITFSRADAKSRAFAALP